jgi:hypothetical protein
LRGNPIASEKGYTAFISPHSSTVDATINICHKCHRPTFIDHDNQQIPGVAFGNTVSDITDASVCSLYDEARRATSASCFTLAGLACRKLLMHIAVSKGATKGETFVHYVEFLANNNFIPPDSKDWVDHIRKKGNEANHEITIMTKDDAEELLAFMEMLLKVIYEFPAKIKKKYAPKP